MKELRQFISMSMVLCMLVSALMFSVPMLVSANPEGTDLIISQAYGAGGKGDSACSHSFIELYNPTGNDISLSGYSITYMSGRSTSANHLGSTDGAAVTLHLPTEASVSANSSYLIRCAAETTTSAVLELDAFDYDWSERYIDNNQFLIRLVKDGQAADALAVTETGGEGATVNDGISKQKSVRRIVDGTVFLDTDSNADDFEIITYKDADQDYVAHYAPKTLADGAWTPSAYEVHQEPSYTAVETTNKKYQGYYNETSKLTASLAARYNSGAMNADGGSAEIVAYNHAKGIAYVVNGTKGTLDSFALAYRASETTVDISGEEIDIKMLVEGKDADFSYGDMTSVAVSPDGTLVAVAIQDTDYTKAGRAVVFSYGVNDELEYRGMAAVGVQPDMIVFVNSDTLLTADEGEPRGGNLEQDPKGSVSIISSSDMAANVVTFDHFDSQREELVEAGVIIQKNTAPSVDFEPEYIVVSKDGKTAYIALQEANAIAVLDIVDGSFTNVYPLGVQDYNSVGIDLVKDKKLNITNYDVYGTRMPDGISIYESNGKTYILTANEGDSRSDWAGLDNEYESKISPTGNITVDEKVVWFQTAMYDGLDSDKDYIFGSRSFSIFEVTGSGLKLVFDSGSDFEAMTSELIPDYFNCSNSNVTLENRSGKKGPEPETVIVGIVNDQPCAFVALERIGGVMIYDISNPSNATFLNYINSRDFSAAIKNDVSPEGLCMGVTSEGATVLMAACEVSGTVAVYELDYLKDPNEDKKPETKVELARCTISDIAKVYYSGKTLTPSVTVKDGTKTLVKGTDFTVTYKNNKNIGTASATITGIGNYTGTITKTFVIGIKKNAKYTVGKYKYQITNAATNGKGTAKLTGTKNKKLTSATVGKTVTIGGKKFQITAVGSKAFYNNKKLTKVTIGANVKTIGKNAFQGSDKLKTITVKSTVLKSVGKNALKGIHEKAVVKVPKKKLASYKKVFRKKGQAKSVVIQ